MEWIEIIVHTTTDGTESVSSLLLEFGASGTMIEDRADIPDPTKPHGIWEIIDPEMIDRMPEDVLVHAWFQADEGFPALWADLSCRLEEMRSANPAFGSLLPDHRQVSDADWTDVWKKYYKPFHIGQHLVIKPTWESYTAQEGDKVIEMDPGMAFGSGTHETTAMCVTLLEETIRGGESVIDIGTGSGILAIAAAFSGAGKVLAVDIDPDAVRVARENVANNRVQDLVTVREGDLLKYMDDRCDICVANIISDIIISFAAPLKDHIVPGGLFICSGIVRQRAEEVKEALFSAGYEVLKEVRRGEWAAFLSRRPA